MLYFVSKLLHVSNLLGHHQGDTRITHKTSSHCFPVRSAINSISELTCLCDSMQAHGTHDFSACFCTTHKLHFPLVPAVHEEVCTDACIV